jgi:hypothetical protein
MSTTARRRVLAVTCTAVVAGAALVMLGTTGSSASPTARDDEGVTAVRKATQRFHDVDAATAAGYIPVSHCEALRDGSAAMGVHYLNPELASDAQINPRTPEVLLYEPTKEGLVLVGVEYFVTEAAAKGNRPSVLGRPLEGPMAGHNDQMPDHYDLHLWVWRDNPDGLAATWNPAVSCDHAS